MATTEYLKEMRGLVVSTILAKIGERRDPELRDYMLDEAAVEIVVKGHVKSLPEFRVTLNRFWDQAQPKKFGLAELTQVTQRCGVERGRYAAIPFYSHWYPKPAGMTDEQATESHRRHWEAWMEKRDEMRRMVMEFGSPEMCEKFDAKEKDVFAPTKAGIPPIIDGCERRVFAPSQWQEYLAFRDAVIDQTGVMSVVRITPDWGRAVDVVPLTLVDAYDKHVAAFRQEHPEPTEEQ